MLKKYSNSRSQKDNIKLGALTAFSSGMVNVASFLAFFTFSSNVTGYYAILGAEIANGHFYQIAIILAWIFLFLTGSFVSGLIVIHFNKQNTYVAHSIPILIEIACLLSVGIYGLNFYNETLTETEYLVALLLFSMGLQNGLTACISNFAVKTTHLTGATTDLGVLFAMLTKKEYKDKKEIKGKMQLLGSIVVSYLLGSIFSGYTYSQIGFNVFFITCIFLTIIILYDMYKLREVIVRKYRINHKRQNNFVN